MILKFYSVLCAPCGSLTSILEKHKLSTTNINVMEDSESVIKHKVRAIPVLLKLDEDGKEVDRLTGMVSEADVLKFFEGE